MYIYLHIYEYTYIYISIYLHIFFKYTYTYIYIYMSRCKLNTSQMPHGERGIEVTGATSLVRLAEGSTTQL